MNENHDSTVRRTTDEGAETMMNDRLETMTMTDFRKWLATGALVVLAACGSAQADGTEDAEASEEFVRVINVQVAPISTNLILSHVATHVLGLPKSF